MTKCIVVTGEHGSGKTTYINDLLRGIPDESIRCNYFVRGDHAGGLVEQGIKTMVWREGCSFSIDMIRLIMEKNPGLELVLIERTTRPHSRVTNWLRGINATVVTLGDNP
jgi:GTPase SAR1 family protein